MNIDHLTDNGESLIKRDSLPRCNSQMESTLNKNNSAILAEQNEPSWSYENYGFRSLPTRGYKKNRKPAIKFMINSETVSQTKKLVYVDHQKSHSRSLCNSFKSDYSNKDNIDQSDSSSSLNSDNDPDIVAALDQIASQMGLIEYPVMRHTSDPIHYLLATRSFSERLSTHKLGFEPHSELSRERSRLSNCEQKSPISVPNIKENISLSNSLPAQTSLKKRSKISKIIQKFSPKILRRSKSIPATNARSPYSEKTNIRNDTHKVTKVAVVKNDSSIISKDRLPTESNHSNSVESNNKIKLEYFNDNSKRLLNSLQVDRIDNSQIKFRKISKPKPDTNQSNSVPSAIINRKVQSLNLTDNVKCEDKPITKTNQFCKQEKSPSSNARYVNISLCAFGYGPHQSVYKSPIDKRTEIFRTSQNCNLISDDSEFSIGQSKKFIKNE